MEVEIIKSFHRNGKIFCEESFLNNLYHGPQKFYYSNGTMWSNHICKNDFEYGICQEWNKDASRNWIEQQKNNRMHGLFVFFKYLKDE